MKAYQINTYLITEEIPFIHLNKDMWRWEVFKTPKECQWIENHTSTHFHNILEFKSWREISVSNHLKKKEEKYTYNGTKD